MLNKPQLNVFVSVIIPVFNDSDRLKLCLQALENQTYSKDLYEVIVVDNASQEDIKSVVSQFSQAKFAYESQPGSYAARNQGISIAKGEILAFTDSDCIPALDWVEKGVENLLSTPNCGLVAGRIDLFFKNPDQPTAVELYESIAMDFPQERSLKKDHYGVTANLFTFKHVIDSVGRFDDTLKSGGDLEWGQRVFAAGYKQVYADDACVAHPSRHSYSQLYKRVARIVGGRYDRMMSRNPSSMEVAIDLVETFKPPFRSLYGIWTNEKLYGVQQKFQFNLVMLFIRYVTILEKLRLYLGGQSKRE
ncbi:glycosyltransferase [Hassallia byssoidea VB512170]|uniref:Glycosyltransferase n=1 Tax=Hassallia byssoidea VB512170 TaxID=1304833 RepID=A0A846HJH2_9CYAN|nr:glycosyltransferase [Hassalia byssoidea]NEU76750.1 glycosyltransferase [Hassalia byssoidea VB512170]